MRLILVTNPSAGEDGVDTGDLIGLLETESHEVVEQSVKEEGWEDALGRDADLVVVAGGDGTVAEVFKALASRGKVATILPLGTANNIATSLGYADVDPHPLIRGWADATRRRCDVCSLSSRGESLEFVESVGGGVFADVLARADATDPQPDGEEKIELGLNLVRDAVAEAATGEWTIEVDGSDLSGEFIAVEAMSINLLGPGIPLAPTADPGDGLLDVVLVRAADRDALATHVEARLERRSPVPLELEVRRGRRVTLRPNGSVRWHCDDDLVDGPLGAERCTVVVESGVEVLVPNERPQGGNGRSSGLRERS